jgi:hypothetical protein
MKFIEKGMSFGKYGVFLLPQYCLGGIEFRQRIWCKFSIISLTFFSRKFSFLSGSSSDDDDNNGSRKRGQFYSVLVVLSVDSPSHAGLGEVMNSCAVNFV